jgi:hypothetical protein
MWHIYDSQAQILALALGAEVITTFEGVASSLESDRWVVLPSLPANAFERRANNSIGFNDFNLKANARIWHWLSHIFHIRSTVHGALCL